MYKVIRSVDLELRPGGSIKFEGEAYGSDSSFFLVKDGPGTGPPLHVHPYQETWVVQRGKARFTVGDESAEVEAGFIVVAPANVPHKFVNTGDDLLEMVCIHPSPRMIQEDLE
jgi:mannose-6-phosphate isomerase-like protein (cupin superfamily)